MTKKPKRKVVVFICGPYRAQTPSTRDANIAAAADAAMQIWRMGAVALCPHKNTAHFDGFLPDEIWLDGDLELLRRCDAVYLLPRWKQSEGAYAEWEEAVRRGIPCWESLLELGRWLDGEAEA